MSFVERVIKEAVENLSISAFEKEITLRNIFSRTFIPNSAPNCAAINPTTIVTIIISKDIPSIFAPVPKM